MPDIAGPTRRGCIGDAAAKNNPITIANNRKTIRSSREYNPSALDATQICDDYVLRESRHTTAVRLVAAGVDATVIQSWLGHAHLDTTNWYAQANLETKRKALEQVDPKLANTKPPRWKRDADLLAWLDSL